MPWLFPCDLFYGKEVIGRIYRSEEVEGKMKVKKEKGFV
jgi:hypothetical protein